MRNKRMPTDSERWMTIAEHLRLSPGNIYEMVQQGQIPCAKLAGRWRFKKQQLDTWMLSDQTG